MKKRYRPFVTVACIVHCQQHYLLVEESIDGKICFNQPAGHLEAHESLVDACIREVKEETGLLVSPRHITVIQQYSATKDLAFLRFTYAVELDEMLKSLPEDPQIIATHWLTLKQIIQLKDQLRSPLVIDSIKDYQQNKGTSPEIIDSTHLI